MNEERIIKETNAIEYLYDFIRRYLLLTKEEHENLKMMSEYYGKRKEDKMINTLENLPQEIKENDTTLLAKWIVKYQKFSTQAALKYAPQVRSESTLKLLFDSGTRYIKTNKRGVLNKSVAQGIDLEISKCTQPLIPSKDEMRKVYKKEFVKKEFVPPVARLDIVKAPLTAKIEYGVKVDGNIKLCSSEDYARGFIDGLKHAGIENVKLLALEITEVENENESKR